MHFEVGIHIAVVSFGKMVMRSFVRWRGYGGACRGMIMDDVPWYVPLLILRRNGWNRIFMMADRRMEDGRFWDIWTQNGFSG